MPETNISNLPIQVKEEILVEFNCIICNTSFEFEDSYRIHLKSHEENFKFSENHDQNPPTQAVKLEENENRVSEADKQIDLQSSSSLNSPFPFRIRPKTRRINKRHQLHILTDQSDFDSNSRLCEFERSNLSSGSVGKKSLSKFTRKRKIGDDNKLVGDCEPISIQPANDFKLCSEVKVESEIQYIVNEIKTELYEEDNFSLGPAILNLNGSQPSIKKEPISNIQNVGLPESFSIKNEKGESNVCGNVVGTGDSMISELKNEKNSGKLSENEIEILAKSQIEALMEETRKKIIVNETREQKNVQPEKAVFKETVEMEIKRLARIHLQKLTKENCIEKSAKRLKTDECKEIAEEELKKIVVKKRNKLSPSRISVTSLRTDSGYACPMCNTAIFKRGKDLPPHINYHNEKLFKCEYCDKGFKSRTSLGNHQVEHLNSELIGRQCTLASCNEVFYFKTEFEDHLATHRNASKFECNLCEITLKCLGDLYRHNEYSHRDNLNPPVIMNHTCTCGVSFRFESGLQNHRHSCSL